MTSTPPENSVVDAALANVSRLATLPEITTRILEIVDNPNASADDLEKLVSSDPILSARVLKVVNSSFYGMPAEVSSIKQALVMLGMGGVKNIALAASLAKLFGGMPADKGFDPQGPWQHSAAVAAAAKLISSHVGGDGEELFLTGLLHDVGTVIAMQALRQPFMELVARRAENPDEPHEAAESEVLGATHEEFGLALCRSWNFPESIQAAIEFHHRPMEAPSEFRREAQIISLADYVAASSGIGYCGAVADADSAQQVIAELGITETQLENVHESMTEAGGFADQISG